MKWLLDPPYDLPNGRTANAVLIDNDTGLAELGFTISINAGYAREGMFSQVMPFVPSIPAPADWQTRKVRCL